LGTAAVKALPCVSTAAQNELDEHDTPVNELAPSPSAGRPHDEPSKVKMPPALSTATQNVVVGHDTEVNEWHVAPGHTEIPGPESTPASSRHEAPFQVNALPARSTVTQNVVVGHEMEDKDSISTTRVGADHEPPCQNIT
jgi:hypothetical protein